MTKHSSHKWISMEEKGAHGRQLVAGNVNNVFRQIGKSECNIISIFGRARQGKSFLMNCLAGETDIFRISNEKESVSNISLNLFCSLYFNAILLFSVLKELIYQISGWSYQSLVKLIWDALLLPTVLLK